jgi:protease-4
MSIRHLCVIVYILALLIVVRPTSVFADAPPAKPTVAVFTLSGPLSESPTDESLPLFGPPGTSLRDVTGRMTKAARDPNVKAVVLLADNAQLGPAQVEELRQSLALLRAANKDVFVHSDSLTMRDYVLFAGASRISAAPTALLWVGGIYGEQPYLRGLLDMLGVQPEFLTCGDYKSAAEIFMRTAPSKQADEMHNWLLDSIFQTWLEQIAKGRNVPVEKAKSWVDGGLYTAEQAKSAGLIDAVEHRQDFTAFLKSKYGNDIEFDKQYGKPKEPQIDFSNPFAMFKVLGELFGGGKKAKSTQPAVGIVYVEGPIMLGDAEPSVFNMSGSREARSSALRKALDQAAADDSIKAVVLRVDSPGGSATASEIILDATRRVKTKKPFVVSMGDVAGSGGYYVACASDVIFADASTITASIGVVSGKIVTTPMWNKIGITFKSYSRGQNAGLFNTDRPFTPGEREKMQAWMDDIYGVFKQHVTDARGPRLKKPLDQIAGGRVYTGRQALELGLVDRIGTLNDAVAFIAKEAKLPEGYEVRPVPEPKKFLEQLMEQSGGGEKDNHSLASLRAATPSIQQLALPYLQSLDPQRVITIRRALFRLDLIQKEGVVLMMPEMAAP